MVRRRRNDKPINLISNFVPAWMPCESGWNSPKWPKFRPRKIDDEIRARMEEVEE